MNQPVPYQTVKILEGCFCNNCGWPVIFVCCNGEMASNKPYSEWDWWNYCSNKTCINHTGKGVFQNKPEWITYNNNLK